MYFFAQVAPAAAQAATSHDPQNLPTLLVGLVTSFIGVLGTISVAFIARSGNRRTTEADKMPDALAVLKEQLVMRNDQVADLRKQRDRAMQARERSEDKLDSLQRQYVKDLQSFAERLYPEDP